MAHQKETKVRGYTPRTFFRICDQAGRKKCLAPQALRAAKHFDSRENNPGKDAAQVRQPARKHGLQD